MVIELGNKNVGKGCPFANAVVTDRLSGRGMMVFAPCAKENCELYLQSDKVCVQWAYYTNQKKVIELLEKILFKVSVEVKS